MKRLALPVKQFSTAKHNAAILALVAVMAIPGIVNIQAQLAILGEFSNPPFEDKV